MKKISTLFLSALACVGMQAQSNLTQVAQWTPQTVSWSASVLADATDYDVNSYTYMSTSTSVSGYNGINGYEGLAFQGGAAFYHFYNGIFNQNSGGRAVIMIDSKAGQRVKVVCGIEESGRINDNGTAVYDGVGTSLRSISNVLTAGFKSTAEADLDESTMKQTAWFDITADCAGFYLNRTGGFFEITLYDVADISEEKLSTYTVQFVDQDGNVLKSEERTGVIGDNPEFLIDDNTTLYDDDNNKYNYTSNDFSTIVLEATGSVATVLLTRVEQWTVYLNYIERDSEVCVATGEYIIFEDSPTYSYNAWTCVDEEQKIYYVASNNTEDVGLAGGATDNYSIVALKNKQVDEIICATPDVFYEAEAQTFADGSEVGGYEVMFFMEAEDADAYKYVPAAYAYEGCSGGYVGQVKGGIADASQLVQLGYYTPGRYRIISDLIANNARNLFVRTLAMGSDEYMSDIDGVAMTYTTIAKVDAIFDITEDMCDTTMMVGDVETPCVALTFGGKDQGSGKFNQSADYDYVAVLKFIEEAIEFEVVEVEPYEPQDDDAIRSVKANRANNNNIYTLQGVQVSESNLIPGVYVQNGKLFIKK